MRPAYRLGSRALALAAVAFICAAAVLGRLDVWIDSAFPDVSRNATVERLEVIDARAAAAYAIARGIGGVLAVAESTTAQGGVGIAGVSVDIGQVLQPAIRLIDAFSDVMIVSLISVTAQIVLVEILSAYALAYVLPAGLVLLALALLLPGIGWRRLAGVVIFVALAARFALPLGVAGTAILSDRFLQPQAQVAEQQVQGMRDSLPDSGALSFHPGEILDRIDRAIQGIITWMAIFLIEAIVMPSVLTLGVLLLARTFLRRSLTERYWLRPALHPVLGTEDVRPPPPLIRPSASRPGLQRVDPL
jgi:hypothetical protein